MIEHDRFEHLLIKHFYPLLNLRGNTCKENEDFRRNLAKKRNKDVPL